MAETAITEVVVPSAKWGLKKLWQELGYMFCYKSNIGDLNEQVQQLRHKKDGIELEEKSAREASKIIDGQVFDWLVKTDEQIKEKETTFSEETVAARAVCCNGWLPNLKGRFSLGRNAKKMTEKVDQLLTTDLGIIAHPAPHAKVEFQPTEDSTQLGTNNEGASSSGTSNHEQPPASERKNIYFDSRRSTIVDVMEALRGNQINPIIICGLGGIGKTTLMGQVFEKAKEEGLFDEYTKATVKESLDKTAELSLIQDELAGYLGLPLIGKQTDARATELRQRLSQGSKKILVMLDNVGTTTPDFLWDVGIPTGCKLLVTSRQQDLFKDMDTRKNFPIHGLPDGDAWSLFKKTAGSSIESDPEVHVVAKKVLKECGGLPIAISTVGMALKGESIGIWKNALRELEKASPDNVPGVIEHVYGKIKLSYECLPNEQAKSCLLLCCIFEESSDILIEDLVIYGHGLGLLRGIESMVEGRNLLETLVQTLKSRFLLLESDKKECVRMHDVVRDIAVHIASEELVEKRNDVAEKRIVVRDKAATMKLMDWPQDSDSEKSTYCSSLSISGFCQLLLLRQITDFPILEPPPTIFKRTEDLKVLTISGSHRWFVSRTLLRDSVLSSLAVMRNLQTLRLERCEFNCDVSVIGELKTLMILRLRGCRGLKQLPDTFKNLSDLRLLDLTDCYGLEVISPGVMSSLTRLEELYMLDSFVDWEVEKLASTETTEWITQMEAEQERAAAGSQDVEETEQETTLYTWKRLNKLAVEHPAGVGMLFRKEVQEPWTQNEDHTRWANSMVWNTGILAELLSLSRLTTLEVALPPLNILLTTTFFNKLERFQIAIGWMYMSHEQIKEPSGNYLRVHHLDVSSVAMGSGVTSLLEKASSVEFKITRPQLLYVLDRVCFLKTKRLKFQECNDVEYLIDTATTPYNSSAIFPVLNSLEIDTAWRLKVIFHGELPTGFLKQLRALILFNLPALTYIWKTNSRSQYDNEEVINFQSLTKLDLSDLPSFTSITKYASKGTERLPEDSSQEQSDITILSLFDTKVRFPVLTELRLGSMNFKEIWNNQLSAESFCELRILRVERCHKLLHLVPTHMQNRMQKLERIHASSCSSLEEIFEFRRLIVDDEGDATASTIFESGNQGTRINKMMSFKESRQAFQNLREILIKRCDSLRTLLSPSVARGLVKLQTLTIGKCQNIKEVVAAAAEGEETEDDNMFPQLHTLLLKKLPNLESFSEGKYNFKWPVVKRIEILYCFDMNKFCSGSLSTPKEVEIEVEEAGESVLQQLNDSRQEI